MNPYYNNSIFFYGGSDHTIIVGDDKQNEVYPQAKYMFKDNRKNFSLRLDEEMSFGSKYSLAVASSKVGKKESIFLSNANFDNEYFTTDEDFNWFLSFKKMPNNYKLYFNLGLPKDCQFNYQDKLTEEEIKEGSFRPENVENSYAIYCSEANHILGDVNWKSGKVGHLFALYFILLDGTKIKANMYIDKGYLVVDVPKELWNWDFNIAPLLLDPTFGYTTAGGSSEGYSGYILGSRLTTACSESLTITNISIYHSASSGNTHLGYGSANTDANPTVTLIAETSEIALSSYSARWDSYSIGGDIASGTYYYLFYENTSDSHIVYYDSGSSLGRKKYKSRSYSSTYPSTIEFLLWDSSIHSMYLTGTAGGGGYAGKIKKYWSILQAKHKKIFSITQAKTKKLDGITNV